MIRQTTDPRIPGWKIPGWNAGNLPRHPLNGLACGFAIRRPSAVQFNETPPAKWNPVSICPNRLEAELLSGPNARSRFKQLMLEAGEQLPALHEASPPCSAMSCQLKTRQLESAAHRLRSNFLRRFDPSHCRLAAVANRRRRGNLTLQETGESNEMQSACRGMSCVDRGINFYRRSATQD